MSNYDSTFRMRRRTPGSFLLVPSPKDGRSIRCQGHLEAAAATILASCPTVTAIQEQPLLIWYAWHKDCLDRFWLLEHQPTHRRRRKDPIRASYIVPDFLVAMGNGHKRLIEVKPCSKVDRPLTQRKLSVARAFAEQEGWSFHLLTDRLLRAGPLLDNLRSVRRYHRLRPDPNVVEWIEKVVPANGDRFGELLDEVRQLVADPVGFPCVLHMLAEGLLSFDPCPKPLEESLLFPKGAVLWDPFASVWAPSGCSPSEPTAWSAIPPPTDSSLST